jgi:hypothetical protein
LLDLIAPVDFVREQAVMMLFHLLFDFVAAQSQAAVLLGYYC